MGSARESHPDLFRCPRSLPICSDLRSLFWRKLFRFAPFSSELFRFALLSNCLRENPDLFRVAPFSSDLFSTQIRTNKSGKPLSADPFCKSLISEKKRSRLGHDNGPERKSRVQEVSRDRSRIIRPSLIAPKHSKRSVCTTSASGRCQANLHLN